MGCLIWKTEGLKKHDLVNISVLHFSLNLRCNGKYSVMLTYSLVFTLEKSPTGWFLFHPNYCETKNRLEKYNLDVQIHA